MALPKRVKVGGSYYKGYELPVSATPGAYILDMSMTNACVINGITITPDTYGIGDYITLTHLASDGVTVISKLADTLFNQGANAAIQLDFVTLELMNPGDLFRLTYNNVSGNALNVYAIVERVR